MRGWLVPRLKTAGIRVCIDCETFEPGAPSITEIERGILQSRKTVLVLTPEYLESGWAEFENILVQTQDPATRQRRVLPVMGTLSNTATYRNPDVHRLHGAGGPRPPASRRR
ncbi:MAG: toll/interleukin-1 receptor domain-containing protein [Gammaproteobacteria bacterium]